MKPTKRMLRVLKDKWLIVVKPTPKVVWSRETISSLDYRPFHKSSNFPSDPRD